MPEVEELKLLGVTFDMQLAFRSHIRQLAVRGAQRLGFLRKASAVLDPKHWAIEYGGFVRPVLEYGMLVWMSAAPTTLARLTVIQRRALHIIGDGSYLPSLDIRRTVAGLCFLYKRHFVEGPEMVKAILPPSAAAPQCSMSTRETTRSATHHPSQLTSILPPQSRNNTLGSFPHSLIATWNQLPRTLLQSPPSRRGMHTFKKNVNDHLVVVVVVVDFIILLGESQQALPFYWEP